MTNAQIALLTLALAVPGIASAQPAVTKSNTIRGTATIQAIDATTRTITLKTKDGERDVQGRPGMTRFNELKVGDTIEVTYIESVVLRVRKPGEAALRPPATPRHAKHGRRAATLGAQVSTTVTVKAHRPGGAVDYRADRRRTDGDAEGRGQEEPRGRQGRRQDRDHLHRSAAGERRADEEVGGAVVARPAEGSSGGGSAGNRTTRSERREFPM